MAPQNESSLSKRQLHALEGAFHRGAEQASKALADWLGKPSLVEHDSLEQLPLEQATTVLGVQDEPICFCSAELTGRLTGELILAFDDSSGLSLADILLGQSPGTATEWSELVTSAALETTNILCCAYLNALIREFPPAEEGPSELLPSPPRFSRDFAESLVEFALMGQAIAGNQVFLARTRFEMDGTPVNWTLLLVPDAESMIRLQHLLPETGLPRGAREAP